MSGFVWKDLLVMKKTIIYYLGIMAVYGVLAVMGVFPYTIVAGFVSLVGMMTPMSTFSYDEMARWEKYAAATPAGRRGVVKGKYAFMLLMCLGSGALALVSLEAMYLLGKGEMESLWEPIAFVASMLGVTLLLNSIILPVMFKYGSEKSRAISMVIFLSVFGSMALLGYLSQQGLDLSGIGAAISAWNPAVALALVAAVVLGGLFLSYRLSLRIYADREL